MNIGLSILKIALVIALCTLTNRASAIPNYTRTIYLDRTYDPAIKPWLEPQASHNFVIYVGGTCTTRWEGRAAGAQDCSIDRGTVTGPGVVAMSRLSDDPVNRPWTSADSNFGFPFETWNTYVSHTDAAVLEEVCDPRYFAPMAVGAFYKTGCWINRMPTISNTDDIWLPVAQLAGYLDTHCQKTQIPATSRTWTEYTTRNTTCKTFSCFGKLGCSCVAWNTERVPAYTMTHNYPANGPNFCTIFNTGGGDNVVRKMLSMYEDRWNIVGVFTSAGAGGGSELASLKKSGSDLDISPLSDNPSRASCGFTNYLDVDTVRSGYGAGWWAYDDTNGRPIYHLAGMASTPWESYLPGADDGAVALHSSLGRADVAAFNGPDEYGWNGNYYYHYGLDQRFWTETWRGSDVYQVELFPHWQMQNRMLFNTGWWDPQTTCNPTGNPPPGETYDLTVTERIIGGAAGFFGALIQLAIDVAPNVPW
jgi:hypothetical protein